MGIISGYPVGAKIVTDLYENGTFSKDEAERLLCFTNNSGPLFIIGTVGILLFGNSSIGILLLLTHILSSLTVGIIFGFVSKITSKNHNKTTSKNKLITYNNTETKIPATISNLGTIFGNSITKATNTIFQIGGFVVLFSVILSIINRLNIIKNVSIALSSLNIPSNITSSLLTGIIELTNGINLAANLHIKELSINILLCAFLLGFGGFSVLLQVLSIISKANLKINKYFYGKLLQGIIATIYTALLIYFVPIFNLNL